MLVASNLLRRQSRPLFLLVICLLLSFIALHTLFRESQSPPPAPPAAVNHAGQRQAPLSRKGAVIFKAAGFGLGNLLYGYVSALMLAKVSGLTLQADFGHFGQMSVWFELLDRQGQQWGQ